MKYALFLAIILPLGILAQDNGIRFEHGSSWQEIKAKAKAENKFIFVDCFTTWCPHCIEMNRNIFPLEKVGDLFNDKFISVRAQLDSSAGDDGEIKAWYGDAHELQANYQVFALPTFLYFSPDGQLVHRVVGGMETADFLARSSEALDPAKQYYPLLSRALRAGTKDTATLALALAASRYAGDQQNEAMLATLYLGTQQNLLTKANLLSMVPLVSTSRDKYFHFFIDNAHEIDQILGDDWVGAIVRPIIDGEELSPIKMGAGQPDWKAVHARIVGKYPAYGDETVARDKVWYYVGKKNWSRFREAITVYMSRYGNHAQPQELNYFSSQVFHQCPDRDCLRLALQCIKIAIEKEQETSQYLDTYANILYKLGKKDDAISWERKAVALAGSAVAAVQPNLDKMLKNEKTWNN